MDPKLLKFRKYSICYFNKEEINILIDEIFKKEIYSINLDTNSPTIFDVGAYIGLSTVYFKDLYPNANIICFEPNPNIFPLLEENVFTNKLSNVVLHNIAVGKEDERKDLYIDSSGKGAFSTASFNKDAWNGKQKSLPIKVRTEELSTYINEYVDLVKIDIEGTEKEVLEELEETEKIGLIRNMLIEYHPKKNSSIKNITDILKRNNFNIEYKEEGDIIDNPKEELILIIAKKRA